MYLCFSTFVTFIFLRRKTKTKERPIHDNDSGHFRCDCHFFIGCFFFSVFKKTWLLWIRLPASLSCLSDLRLFFRMQRNGKKDGSVTAQAGHRELSKVRRRKETLTDFTPCLLRLRVLSSFTSPGLSQMEDEIFRQQETKRHLKQLFALWWFSRKQPMAFWEAAANKSPFSLSLSDWSSV